MARAYSQDLRDRVIDAGTSAREAAERFGIGVATAIVWTRRAREGERSARKQGQPKRSKLDPHRAFLLCLVEAEPDITIAEMQERLRVEAEVEASTGTIWTFLDRAGLTFKKDRPRNRAGSPRRPDATGSLVRGPARPRSRPARLHRRDLDVHQHGSAARSCPEG